MKRKLKSALSLLLCMIMVFGALAVGGEGIGAKLDGMKANAYSIFTHEVINGKVKIVRCDTAASGAVTVPASIDGKPVVSIGDCAFGLCDGLTKITIPDGVKYIGENAFAGCTKVTSIELPDSVQYIGSAFDDCRSLTSITIPRDAEFHTFPIFRGCTALKSINVDSASKLYTSENGVLFSKSKSKLITYPAGKTDSSYTIPSSVTKIGLYSFENCTNLKSINIPSSVTSMDIDTLRNCSGLISINVDKANKNYSSVNGVFFNKSKTKLIQYPAGKADSSYTIPSGVTEIGYDSFANCSNIKSINIPSNITSIGSSAFSNCSGLTSVTIPSGVKRIDYGTFYGCSNLSAISLPDSINYISRYAFDDTAYYKDESNWENGALYIGNALVAAKYYGDDELSGDFWLKEGTRIIAENVFFLCDKLKSINVSSSNKYFSSIDGVLYSKDKKTLIAYPEGKGSSYSIPNGVTSIGDDAFSYQDGLSSVTIPNSITSIGSGAFYNCKGLTSVTIPSSVTSIGSSAFNGCKGLTSLTISNGVKSIGGGAFSYCSGLTSVNTPSSVTNIGGNAFAGCNGLSSLTISNGVTSIGDRAFSGCSGLKSVTIPGSVTSIGYYAFLNCNGLKSINVDPKNVSYISENGVLFNYDKTNLMKYPAKKADASYVIPDSVKSIHFDTFANCSGLTSVTIPNSVKSITSPSFDKCINLSNVYYEGTEKQWNNILSASVEYLLCYPTIHFAKKDGFTITYNANGGSGAPGEQSTDELNGRITISSQIPHRDGYEFIGWATSPSASKPQYSPKDTVSSSRDLTLYAVWEKSYLLSIKDIYSFPNDSSYFFKRNEKHRYQMLDSDFEKLCNYVRNIYEDQDFASTEINNLQYQRKNVEWYGSCFGMSLTAIFNKTGKIDFNKRYGSGAASMSAVAAPNKSAAVRSAINYYQLSQHIPVFYNPMNDIGDPAGLSQMRGLIDAAKNNKLILFSYKSPQLSDGHAIVIVGYSAAADGSHTLIAYDNRYEGQYININVSSDLKKCTLILPDKKEDVSSLAYRSGFSAFDMIDIDGPNNDMRLSDEKYNMNSCSLIGFTSSSAVTVKNSKGQTLTYKDGEFGGDLEILSKSMIVRSTADGSPAPEIITVNVKESDTFTFEGTDKNLNVSLTSKNIFANVETTADKVVISENEGIHASGNDISFNGSLSLNNSVCNMLEFDGQASGDVKMTYSGDGIIVDGASGNGSVTVYSNVVDTNTAKFNTDCSSIKISGDGSGVAGNVEITASSKNDGVYDIKLAEMQNRKFAFGEKNITMYYKATGSVAIASNEEVVYTSSNPDIVSVDASGNITALKTGSATITAIEADSGKSDTCTVTVKYAWWQILIRILLLGFLWY